VKKVRELLGIEWRFALRATTRPKGQENSPISNGRFCRLEKELKFAPNV